LCYNRDVRIVLFTGKGGVGKTSVAAATALRAAELGYKTIIFSTDAAHSLGDSFDMPLGPEPVPVAPNLWGQEAELTHSLATFWDSIQRWLTAVLVWRGVDQTVAQEIAILPGMEELANLLYIQRYFEQGDYQTIIVDCAPTGETLRLLSFPEVLRWWMDKVLPWERRAASVMRPFAKRFLGMPFPEDAVFDATQELFLNLGKLSETLTDPDTVSVRLVVNPEKMVIKEAQRTHTYLSLYGYSTDLVICNRVIPDAVGDSYFSSWKAAQARYLRIVEEGFSPIPIRTVPLLSQEVVGLPMLRQMAEALYGRDDPTQLFYRGQAQRVERRDGHFYLTIALPFTSKESIDIMQNGDELVVQVGSYRRNIILPRTLVGLGVAEARFQGDRLLIKFRGKGDGGDGGDGKDTGGKPGA
ncbi:MAG: TRC40/GET3/ArsA family transport-energizing ATPase, partial [Chloroflexota bacterium]